MNKLSRFSLCCFVVLASASLSAQPTARVNSERLNQSLEDLKQYGMTEGGGSMRVAYSEANRDALVFLSGLMEQGGLSTFIDPAGNLVGRREGQEPDLPPIISGSHIDTVPNGGHYDGIVGSLAAIEVARSLFDQGIALRHPLEVIIWSNEEGGKTGSRSFNGSVLDFELTLPSLGQRNLGAGMDFLGGNAAGLTENKRESGSMAGYVELHVEQGAILDREGISIGVVEGIVGIRRWNVTVSGFANHAGTTPMNQRQDAMVAAAQLITAINESINAVPGSQVGTVGRLQASPGAPNVIPGEVVFSLEIRDLSMEKITSLFASIESKANAIEEQSQTQINFVQFYESPAALTYPGFSSLIESAAQELQLSYQYMPSGAGHDAQSLAPLGPIAMIFVPSVEGISHAPTEFTAPEDVVNGANVLLQTILKMDANL